MTILDYIKESAITDQYDEVADGREDLLVASGYEPTWKNMRNLKTKAAWAPILEELGEIARLFHRALRDGKAIEREALTKELGDLCWYLAKEVRRTKSEMLYKKTEWAEPGYFQSDYDYLYVVGEILPRLAENVSYIASGQDDWPSTSLPAAFYLVARLAAEWGISMAEIFEANIAKIKARKASGTIHGDGDYRQEKRGLYRYKWGNHPERGTSLFTIDKASVEAIPECGVVLMTRPNGCDTRNPWILFKSAIVLVSDDPAELATFERLAGCCSVGHHPFIEYIDKNSGALPVPVPANEHTQITLLEYIEVFAKPNNHA